VRYSWVGVRSLCVEYAWLCDGHALAVSTYASDLDRNRARPRRSTDAPPSYNACTAHVSRSCAERKCLYVVRSQSERVWTHSVGDSCVGRTSNNRGILLSICSYVSTCTTCQWFVSDCKWHVRSSMRGSCVNRQWFLSPTPQQFGQYIYAQARTTPIYAICDRLCDWPFILVYVTSWCGAMAICPHFNPVTMCYETANFER